MTNKEPTRRGARRYWARYRAKQAATVLLQSEEQTDLWHPDDRVELTVLGRRIIEVLDRRTEL